MSNAQHTPGPWFVAAFGLNKVATITNVTSIYSDVRPGDKSIAADACLIAAAPELLEALQRLSAQCERLRLPGQTESDAERTARAVIAKATGGAA